MGEARPTPEEFEDARRRELSRLNVRITSTIGHKRHTHEDDELLVGDSAKRRWADMATVRRWSEHTPRHGRGDAPYG